MRGSCRSKWKESKGIEGKSDRKVMANWWEVAKVRKNEGRESKGRDLK